MWITTAYWGFTLTDGALRMLVVLYFHQLGYSPLEVASLFLFYEFFGIITNLFGGWLGARFGLKSTLFSGLALQILALSLLAQTQWLSVAFVMIMQAISGIAKDLNKMSAKTAIKQLVPEEDGSTLFKWVSLLTGSKNALKGVGFFLGGLLLSVFGYQNSLYLMVLGLSLVTLLCVLNLKSSLKAKKYKAKFNELFSKSSSINLLSAARFFLFSARDVWFVVALPVFLISELKWQHGSVGILMAAWVILYGIVQSLSPKLLGFKIQHPNAKTAVKSATALLVAPLSMIVASYLGLSAQNVVVIGLLFFAIVFAINSAVHSFLIVHYANNENASLDVGFYYMANAGGRLFGTILSGLLYQKFGFQSTIWTSLLLIAMCVSISFKLARKK
ncbi:Predicted arabinose efflux permease, MFS family [Pseudoalteromonas denitrificans DSM 6059]|uniref:Predicted arabinose efflux permease, MFS family n=2 Tax=Pseudoalteromonas TaxID=53246 RepID=A0A1I1LQE6_9GAMM|nr:Predicted arabinose efflux permease, MFS family [Pseudoalteromonas denitrificans DSM 6059]